MNTATDKKQEPAGAVYFLSDIIGTKIFTAGGRKIGKLRDIAIREDERLPVVTHFIVKRPFGARPLLIPWAKVVEVNPGKIVAGIESAGPYEGEPDPSQVLLNDHVLDKKVLDLDDNEIDVVYDIKLVLRNRVLYVTDVDFSRYALFKRLGLKPVMKLFLGGTALMKKETLSWSYVQPLPEDIGRFRGNVKLKVLKEKLPEIHPVDMADIL
ncbi:MAG: PRC-barrel domain-containing protein [Nitrospiraceae bacterium]|nr:PRC-barrel domain-containing protein [Nitrospiraceae bacterium]